MDGEDCRRLSIGECSDPVIESHGVNPGEWNADARHWAGLFAHAPRASPYLTPSWVHAYVDTFAAGLPMVHVNARNEDGALIGTCLFTQRIDRRALVPLSRWHLNTAGERDEDSVVVEHNALLCEAGHESRVYADIAELVDLAPVDELTLAGATEDAVTRFCAALPHWSADIEWRDSPYVDLEALRAAGGDHLAVLSRNTRERLRRSLRRYREVAELRVEVATSVAEALAMFDEMVTLHEARWHALGQVGGFASQARRDFHRTFIQRAHGAEHVQLLRVCHGKRTLGVLYNLVANGHVCFYQSGVRYDEGRQLSPGLVVHHLAIGHCLSAGFLTYDFLPSAPGEGRYKLSLATDTHRLGTVLLRRPGWRGRWFALARSLKRRFR